MAVVALLRRLVDADQPIIKALREIFGGVLLDGRALAKAVEDRRQVGLPRHPLSRGAVPANRVAVGLFLVHTQLERGLHVGRRAHDDGELLARRRLPAEVAPGGAERGVVDCIREPVAVEDGHHARDERVSVERSEAAMLVPRRPRDLAAEHAVRRDGQALVRRGVGR